MATKSKRTTHRSKSGTKLYAVRDASGRFKDIQDLQARSRPGRQAEEHEGVEGLGSCASTTRMRTLQETDDP